MLLIFAAVHSVSDQNHQTVYKYLNMVLRFQLEYTSALTFKVQTLIVCVCLYSVRQTVCNLVNLGIATRTETVDPRCADKGFVSGSSISGGVVCYNGTTAGSKAAYVCIDGFVLMGNEARVCQKSGSWNGSIPQCMPEGGMCCSQFHQFRIITAYRVSVNCLILFACWLWKW